MPKKKSKGVGRHPVIVNLGDVTPKQVVWVWPDYIPRGKLTLLTGMPGIGKSFILLDIASRITSEDYWPDTKVRAPLGNVIFMTAEDDLDDTVAPRVDAAGGVRSRITVVKHVIQSVQPELELVFSLALDLPGLEQLIEEKNPVVVLIDPITSYLGDIMNKANEVRALLDPVRMLAERMNVAIVGIMHPNKSSDQMALHRIGGSAAFGEVARQALACVRNDDGNFFGVLKSNVGKIPDCVLKYELSQSKLAWAPRVVWQGEHHGRIDELMDAQTMSPLSQQRAQGQSKKVMAKQWLLQFLLDNGETPVRQIMRAAAQLGEFSWSTVEAVKKELQTAGLVGYSTTGSGDNKVTVWFLVRMG